LKIVVPTAVPPEPIFCKLPLRREAAHAVPKTNWKPLTVVALATPPDETT
jgi:hypothetical protein